MADCDCRYRYLNGENERIWLATANSELRSALLKAEREIEWLREIASELADAFQVITDQGDDCPLCWDGFKATRAEATCHGHAAVLEWEEDRRG